MEFYLDMLHKVSLKVKVLYYIPERPAPFTSNPDDPGFSDPGDSEEFEFEAWFDLIDEENNDGELLIPIPDIMYEYIYDEVLYNYKKLTKE